MYRVREDFRWLRTKGPGLGSGDDDDDGEAPVAAHAGLGTHKRQVGHFEWQAGVRPLASRSPGNPSSFLCVPRLRLPK